MTHALQWRPRIGEYDEFYETYIGKVLEEDVLRVLRTDQAAWLELLAGMPAAAWDTRYAPEKWSVRELVGHVIDAEREFSGRAFRFARGDGSAMPGMDQHAFVAGADFARRAPASLIGEFEHLRSANIALFASFDQAVLGRTGVASDCRFTVRALIYIIAGHSRHHLGVLKTRYR